MTKEIQFSACTMSLQELKALVNSVEMLQELNHDNINHFETFNHEIDEMYDKRTNTWTVSVKNYEENKK